MDLSDVVTAVGLVMLFAGLWLLAPWLALTVTGGLMIVVGLVSARLAAAQDVREASKGVG